jgi:hypothetical protein
VSIHSTDIFEICTMKYVLSNIYMYIWESYSFDWLSIIDIFGTMYWDIFCWLSGYIDGRQWMKTTRTMKTMKTISWRLSGCLHNVIHSVDKVYIYTLYIYKQSMNILWGYFMILWYDMSNVYIYVCVYNHHSLHDIPYVYIYTVYV